MNKKLKSKSDIPGIVNKKLKSFCIKQLPKYFRKYTEENEIVDVIGVDNALIMIKVLYKQEFAHNPSKENITMVIWQKLTRLLGNDGNGKFETWNRALEEQIEDLLKKELPGVSYVEIGKILDVNIDRFGKILDVPPEDKAHSHVAASNQKEREDLIVDIMIDKGFDLDEVPFTCDVRILYTFFLDETYREFLDQILNDDSINEERDIIEAYNLAPPTQHSKNETQIIAYDDIVVFKRHEFCIQRKH